jgi:hypothetical protein
MGGLPCPMSQCATLHVTGWTWAVFTRVYYFPNATTCPYRLHGLHSWLWPKCNLLLRLGRPWGAVTLPRWCEWWYVGYKRWVPGGAFNLNSTGYPDRGHYGDLPLQRKIPMAEPGIEPGTSWLVVRRSDHQAARLVIAQLNCLIALSIM